MLIEAYVDSLESAVAAEAAGADRLELCGPGEGGLTPSDDLLRAVLAVSKVPVHAMIRPREGDFVYSAEEIELMRKQIETAKRAGAAGVVLGVLREDSTIDAERMWEFIGRARAMRLAFHRAFDQTPDADAAFETLRALGVDIVLTSGHAATALEGAETIARHVARAGDRLSVLAGGKVRAGNVRQLAERTAVREVHARASDVAEFRALVKTLRPR